MSLVPCTVCARHVRVDETACPFCGGALEARRELVPSGAALSRAAVLFAGAAALAACGKKDAEPAPVAVDAGHSEPIAVAVYGPPPMMADAGIPVVPPPPKPSK